MEYATLTIPDESSTSNSIQVSGEGGVIPTAIICPAAYSGTLFRLEVKTGSTWTQLKSPGSGSDFPYTLSASGRIPIDGDTARDLKGEIIRIVTASSQTSGPVVFKMRFKAI